MAGELVGEAWVAIHARDGGMSREVKAIAKNAAEDLSKDLDKEIQKQTEARFAGDRSVIARLLQNDDQKAIDDAIKRWRTPEAIEAAMERMVRQVSDKKIFNKLLVDMDDAMDRVYGRMQDMEEERLRKIRDAQEKILGGGGIRTDIEREQLQRLRDTYGELGLELEKLRLAREKKVDDALLRVLDTGDWTGFLRHMRETDNAQSELIQSVGRLSKQYDDFHRDSLAPLMDSLDQYQEQQKRIADDKAFQKIAKDWDAALAEDKIFEANRRWGELHVTARRFREELEQTRDLDMARVLATGDVREFTKSYSDADKAVKEFREELDLLSRDNKVHYKDWVDLTKMIDEYENSVRKASVSSVDFAEAQRRAASSYRDSMDRQIATAFETKDWSSLNDQMRDTVFISGEVKKRMDELRRAGVLSTEQIHEMNDSYRDWRREGRNTIAVIDAFPDVLGRAFGRGSRNNFLNFFGSTLRNLAQLPISFGRAAVRIGKSISDIVENFRFLRDNGATLGKALTGSIGPALARIGPTLAVVGVGVAFLVKFVPMLSSAVSMLTGILTAWVGVLVNGVLGSLVVLGPVIVSVLGGFVGLGVAIGKTFAEMNKIKEEGGELTREMKLLDGAISDMSSSMDRFTDTVMPEAARSFSILGDAVSSFLDAIGPGVEEGLRRFNNIISGDSMNEPLAAWRDSLPGIFSDFTAALGQMAAGLVKFFEPILPYAERLAEALYDMMFNFNKWAGSVGGQNTIANWMDTAWRAADALWGTLGNVLTALMSVFNIGTETTGLAWLESLEEKTKNWNKALQDDEGRNRVISWFEDARETGENLWEIISDTWELLRELDTEQAREDLNSTLEAVSSLIEAFSEVAPMVETASEAISGFFTGYWDGMGAGETGNQGADLGMALGLTPENAEKIAEDWAMSFDEKVLRTIFGDGFYDAVEELDRKTIELFNDVFGTQGETWNQIGADLGNQFITGVTDFWGENEQTKDLFNTLFGTQGETWGEIGAELGGIFMEGLDNYFGENEDTKELARKVFGVDGESWSEIGPEIGRKLWTGIKDFFSAGEGENEDTKAIARRMFGVEGDTWQEIGRNIVDNVKQGISEWWEGLVADTEIFLVEWRNRLMMFFLELPGQIGIWLAELGAGFILAWDTAWSEFWTWLTEKGLQLGEWFLELPTNIPIWLAALGAGIVLAWTTAWVEFQVWLAEKGEELRVWFTELPGKISSWLSDLGSQYMTNWLDAREQVGTWMTNHDVDLGAWAMAIPGKVASWMAGLATEYMTNFLNAREQVGTWMSNHDIDLGAWAMAIPGKVRSWLSNLATEYMANFRDARRQVGIWMTQTGLDLGAWFMALPGRIGSWLAGVADAIAQPFRDAWGYVDDALATIWRNVSSWVTTIKNAVSDLPGMGTVSRIGSAVSGILGARWMAEGGIVSAPTPAIIGEAGREAVIPLDRPLSQIDPSVRDMAAQLRGKGGGVNFESGSIILQYAGRDPYRAAESFLDGIAETLA